MMEMTLVKNLTNRVGTRDSESNPSFLGHTQTQVDEFIDHWLNSYRSDLHNFRNEPRQAYRWTKGMKGLLSEYLQHKVSGIGTNRPITSKRRCRTAINQVRFLDQFMKKKKITLNSLSKGQARDLIMTLNFALSQTTNKPLSDSTKATYVKSWKAFIRFINSSKASKPIEFDINHGLRFILDHEPKTPSIKVVTYSENEMARILNSTDFFSRFFYNTVFHTRCRVSELIDSNLGDFYFNQEKNVILWSIKVSKTSTGLGTVVISGKTMEIFGQFLDTHHNLKLHQLTTLEKDKDRPLVAIRRYDGTWRRMQHRPLLDRLKRDCRMLKISEPHQFKRFRSTGLTTDALDPNISEEMFNAKARHSVKSGARRHYLNREDSRVIKKLIEIDSPNISNTQLVNPKLVNQLATILQQMNTATDQSV